MKPHRFGIALNSREEWISFPFVNWIRILTAAWSPSHLVRHVLETSIDYGSASTTLKDFYVSISSFFTIIGVNENEGEVI